MNPATTDHSYDAITIAAIHRWWEEYGRTWFKVRRLVDRGWEHDDILQEVLMSSVTKSKGRSRWDPSRSNVDAWAGLVGRSRVGHLLERRVQPRALPYAYTFFGDGEPLTAEDKVVEPMDWEAHGAPPRDTSTPSCARKPRPKALLRRNARQRGGGHQTL